MFCLYLSPDAVVRCFNDVKMAVSISTATGRTIRLDLVIFEENSGSVSIFSERQLTSTFAIMSSPVRLSSVCNVCAPYWGDWNVRQCFYAITLTIYWHPGNILRISTQGNPPSGELNTTGVAEYRDFGPSNAIISETRCKIGAKLLLVTN